eukprot:TRINITY_DN10464_c0_g1_i2.p1 TRINITY_DN10464_c0_g1~~TRINITY_DN10464_c0_g1_i2.p1  ORF type:complete len:185 (-),score=20.43 TRINITY_DN10464_c0_g1_i2:260-814(-)
MKYGDGLLVVAISLVAAALCEFISWVLIYRTPSYRTLRQSIDRTSRRVETMKERQSTTAATSRKTANKKIERFEQSLKDANQALSRVKFQSGAVVAVSLLIVFGLLNTLFDGKPVAKLPFKPWAFFQRMTHRNLPGDDPTDCAMVFLYMLCSMSIRPNLQKLLGFAPPRSANQNMFGALDAKNK